MRIHSDDEIIKKAYSKIDEEVDSNAETLDIAIDLPDEHEVAHSYVVTFKKNESGEEPIWKPFDITEISTW
jgi:hypothetical protein